MREILFRGKTKTGRWVYGSLILAGSYCCILEPEDDVHPMDYPYLDPDLGIIDGEATPVIRETVGQFTGVKDKSSRKIFEGDIIKCSVSYSTRCYPIFKTEIRGVVYVEGCFNPLYDCERNTYEVIGNIHDNPKLLEVTNDGY